MSIALARKGGLRWWTQDELAMRQEIFQRLNRGIQQALLDVNRGWTFEQCEAPMLVPRSMVSEAYTDDDVFFTGEEFAMRPETTKGSFMYAAHLFNTSKIKPPLCVYQIGKSYRIEKADGASPSKYRYNEFTQAEWQCLYSYGTKADYISAVEKAVADVIADLNRLWIIRVVDSDRLPDYSRKTTDIEVSSWNADVQVFTEVCSMSERTDFDGLECFEVAVGIDRVIDLIARSKAGEYLATSS